jgi:hypothetical protein
MINFQIGFFSYLLLLATNYLFSRSNCHSADFSESFVYGFKIPLELAMNLTKVSMGTGNGNRLDFTYHQSLFVLLYHNQ